MSIMPNEKVIVFKGGMTKAQIDALWKKVHAGQRKRGKRPLPDIRKFCGVITLKEDPMEIQRKMRDEWD